MTLPLQKAKVLKMLQIHFNPLILLYINPSTTCELASNSSQKSVLHRGRKEWKTLSRPLVQPRAESHLFQPGDGAIRNYWTNTKNIGNNSMYPENPWSKKLTYLNLEILKSSLGSISRSQLPLAQVVHWISAIKKLQVPRKRAGYEW